MGWAAYLRIYEPLAALPDGERERWTSYVETGDTVSRSVLMARERDVALTAALRTPPRVELPADAEHAYVRHLDGLTYVCPWRLQQRIWSAIEDFRDRLPDSLADAFIPGPVAEQALAAAEVWRAAHPDDTIGIRTSTWQVPVAWFVLFEASERRLVLGERAGGTVNTGLDRALVYLTQMSRARRRCAQALQVVRRAFDDAGATLMIEELGRWIEGFHPHSLVELDYGGLVHLLDDETLDSDDSVGDVEAAVAMLAEGRLDAAGERYAALIERWRTVGAFEHAS